MKFIDYLKEVHAELYMGTHDDMPDSFWSWIEDLDAETLIEYAERWYSPKEIHLEVKHQ
jgi:hypothetical protein